MGLNDRIHHRPNQLSGGQKQRVAIARAILNNPAILFADEPTGNLDSATTRQLMKVFEALHDERQTIIVVTHETDVAAHCSRIIQLTDGLISSDLKTGNGQARTQVDGDRPEVVVAPAAASPAPKTDGSPR